MAQQQTRQAAQRLFSRADARFAARAGEEVVPVEGSAKIEGVIQVGAPSGRARAAHEGGEHLAPLGGPRFEGVVASGTGATGQQLATGQKAWLVRR